MIIDLLCRTESALEERPATRSRRHCCCVATAAVYVMHHVLECSASPVALYHHADRHPVHVIPRDSHADMGLSQRRSTRECCSPKSISRASEWYLLSLRIAHFVGQLVAQLTALPPLACTTPIVLTPACSRTASGNVNTAHQSPVLTAVETPFCRLRMSSSREGAWTGPALRG